MQQNPILDHAFTSLITLAVSLLGSAITRAFEKRRLRKNGKLKD